MSVLHSLRLPKNMHYSPRGKQTSTPKSKCESNLKLPQCKTAGVFKKDIYFHAEKSHMLVQYSARFLSSGHTHGSQTHTQH